MDESRKDEMIEALGAGLTEEQKEKAERCRTAEELEEFLDKENIELPDELLEKAAGGGEIIDMIKAFFGVKD